MSNIRNIADIDTSTETGKLLVAATSLLSTECLVPKSYNQIIEEVSELAEHMYGKIEEPNEFTYSV